MVKLTPMEHEIMKVLADGYVHSIGELCKRINSGDSNAKSIQVMVSYLRRKLQPLGEGIASHILDGVAHYQYVRLTAGGTYRG